MMNYVAKITLFSFLWWVGMLVSGTTLAQTSAKINKNTLPNFKFYDLKGNVFSAQQIPYNNYLTVVYFDPSCEHCLEQTEQIKEHINLFKNTKMVWVSFGDPEQIAEFKQTHFPNNKNMVFLYDKDIKIFDYFDGLDDTPTFVIFDKNKKLVATVGQSSVEKIAAYYR